VYNLTAGRVKLKLLKMKKLVFTAFAVGLSLTANVMAQVPSYVPSNGLVGYWPFNGNANDESGNGNNGTVNGATLTTDRFGVANKAYNFDGNDWIALNLLPAINNSNELAVSVWVKSTGTNTNTNCSVGCAQTYFSRGYDGANGFMVYSSQDAAPEFISTVNGAFAGGVSVIDANSTTIPHIQWNHLIMNYDGSTVKFYVNGVLVGTTNYINNVGNDDGVTNAAFGRQFVPNYPYYTVGRIDDGAIWNRALTQQEITALYQSCSNPVATITSQGSTAFCSGGSLNLTASTGIGYTYQWFRNGTAISNATASSYSATLAGNYTVVISSNGCSSTSAATTVTVNPNPSVTLTGLNSYTNFYTSPITLTGNPSGGTYTGPGVSSNLFNPSIAGLGVNSVNYSYTTAAGCSGNASQSTIVYDTLGVVCTTYDTITTLISVTDTLIINTTLSLPAPNNENTILIYPNPASDHITIDNGNFAAMSGYSIKIENNAGQQVFQSAINQAQFYVDMSTWTGNGLYFVHLIDPQNNTVTVRKIVLQ
jgi:hypothetical protein